MTDYKKYALGQLENFLYDAMSAEATPQEIYDTIRDAVQDNLNVYTKSADQARELLSLLNGKKTINLNLKDLLGPHNSICDKDNSSQECKGAWNDFWEEPSMPPWGHSDLEYGIHYSEKEVDEMCAAAEVEQDMKNIEEFLKTDRVIKWSLPVEEQEDGEYYITLPDDLLEATNFNEGDQIEWIPQDNGSYLLKKVEVKN